MKLIGLCADPGVPLDATKGASIHLIAIWNALARAGCELEGFAAWRGGAMPRTFSGVRLHPMRAEGPAALRAAIREAASSIDADAVLERLALGSDLGLELAKARDMPLAVEVNAPLDEEAERFRSAPSTRDREMLARTLRGCDVAYVVSAALRPWCAARGARDVRVVPNGVDLELFDHARRAGDSSRGNRDRIRVVFVGSFKPWHGVEVLLDAFAAALSRVPGLELELVGDGPGRDAAVERAAALGISDRTIFTGALPHTEVPARLLAADIAVAPASADAPTYFSALKLREYAAAGCAIIAASLGQVEEQFRDGEHAVLVPSGDPEALRGSLERLAGDSELRRRLGAAAAELARGFDWASVAAALKQGLEASIHARIGP